MTPRVCNYYVTLRCNASCEFCGIWRQPDYQQIEEKPYDLAPLRRAGVSQLQLTGGEPLLREDLPAILRQARELGFEVTLTTNGLLYAERAKEIAGLIAQLYFSLDYPTPAEHDRSRGVESFHAVLAAVDRAKSLGEKARLNFTLTRDNVRFLPEMVELAGKLKIPIRLEPVYDFHGTQGFEPATLEAIRYFGRRRGVLVNLAALAFVRAGGNRVLYPRCRARETTVTILPDGSRVEPCFFNPGGKQGRADRCSSCMRWPYMLPSFSAGLDKYFWLNLWSQWLDGRKMTNAECRMPNEGMPSAI